MRPFHTRFFLVIAVVACILSGCSKKDDADAADAASAANNNAPATASNTPTTPDSVANDKTKIINDSSQIKPGAAFRIQPKNPNDPHFKQDPRLGGGG